MQTRYQKTQKECPICFDPISTQGCLDQCSHVFCAACISQWAKNENSCPLCKKRFGWISSIPTRPNYSERQRRRREAKGEGRVRARVERRSQQERNPFVQIYVNSLQAHEFLNTDQDIQFLNFLLNLQQELNQL